ncbi:hypothetical protein GVAV_000819 [Gurleya vavrai]
MILFYLTSIFSWKHNIILQPRGTETFYEILNEKDENATIDVTSITDAKVQYKVTTPAFQSNGFQLVNKSNNLQKYTEPGQYTIEIVNLEDFPVLCSVGTYIDKSIEVDEDTRYIKSIIDKLRSDLRNIYNSNLRLKEIKEINLRQVKRDRKWMLLLLILPIFYFLVGYISFKMQKNFFTPKK